MELNQAEVKEVIETASLAIELERSELSDLQLALVGGGVGDATFG